LRTGVGVRFSTGFGAARGADAGVTDVLRDDRDTEAVVGRADGELVCCEVAGAGEGEAARATGRADVVVADEATTGGSGVGTARADSDERCAGRDAGAVAPVFDGFEADDVANPPGGASGAGIGVPPAAQLVAGQRNATMQTPAASESRQSRRDDVQLDTTSLPFGASRYVGRRTCVNGAGVAAGRPAATTLPSSR
jgi:hypothetical protein